MIRILEIAQSFFSKKKSPVSTGYVPAMLPCSSTIALCGPCYGDITYTATFLLDTKFLLDWVNPHSKSVWSSKRVEQQAREHLPVWLAPTRKKIKRYIALLDGPTRGVLMPYIYDFYLKGLLRYYCHLCKSEHCELVENNHGSEKSGDVSRWVEEWQCPAGHVVHSKHEELRWITRKS